MKINVELISGKICALEVQPDITVPELKEALKPFHPSQDQVTRKLSTLEIFVHGEKLNELDTITPISFFIPEGAKVQAVFSMKSAIECARAKTAGCVQKEWYVDVQIPDGTSHIEPHAFESCGSLLRVFIPESVTDIQDWAFADCSSLPRLTLPGSVTEIGRGAFRNCSSLTSLTVPDSVTHIGDHAFAGCSCLSSLTIPGSVIEIGLCAFRNCRSLESLTIPNSVSQIEDYAFAELRRQSSSENIPYTWILTTVFSYQIFV